MFVFRFENLKTRNLKNKCYYYFYMNLTTQNDLNFGDFALLKKRLVLYAFHLVISNTLILFLSPKCTY